MTYTICELVLTFDVSNLSEEDAIQLKADIAANVKAAYGVELKESSYLFMREIKD